MQQQYSAHQQDQYGNQHPMAQPMMLCPIQYVYETPMFVQPSIQEEQVQAPPYLLNVQNPPPWINRQNVVYVQPNIPIYNPNMIQSPIYHQQVNYVPQIVPQELRQIQMPIRNQEQEKMPVLTQMLKTNQVPRLVMQNQQVQTDISSRPTPRPQVITINPMQQRFHKDLRPRHEIPSHIRTKLPSNISIKTIYRPILPRPVRPYETNTYITTNNEYYNNFVAPQPINAEFTQNVKQEAKKFKNEECQTVNKVVHSKVPERVTPSQSRPIESTVETPAVAMATQKEEKMLRNTVFVQARGRVLEKEVVINHLKRTLDDRLQENMAKTQIPPESPKRVKTEEPPVNNIEKPSVPFVNSPNNQTVTVIPENNKSLAKPEVKTNAEIKQSARVAELDNLKTQLNNVEHKDITEKSVKIEDVSVKNSSNQAMKEASKNENSVKENIKINSKSKEDKIVVLTHVLDGHIIQESNFAFPIQKLSKEAENDKNSDKVSPKSVDIEKHDVIPHLPMSYHHLTKTIEAEENNVAEDVNKDCPFGNVQKSTVRTWTTEQLADHLVKLSGWKDTALKLLDQELDGESLFLVNKEQLAIIGVNETHAELIDSFVSKN